MRAEAVNTNWARGRQIKIGAGVQWPGPRPENTNTSFGVNTLMQCCFDSLRNETSNQKYRLELIKKRPNLHEKNMPHERALNFDQ